MNGWLVVNGYLNSNKFEEIYQWLIEAANRKGCTLSKITNDRLVAELSINSGKTDWRNKPDFVLFWDKDIKLAKLLEKNGLKLYNNAAAIEACDDKALTFINLKETEISMPKTYMSPMTFNKEYTDFAFLIHVENKLGFPFIIKANKGSFGAQVFLINSHQEALDAIKKIETNEFIMQEYLEHSKGRDIRLNVVGDKVVTAMMRKNENDFRANVTNGGSMERYTPTLKEEQLAIEVCKKLGLDFAGVDILFGENEEPVLCEVNSNAHFKNIYDCTGVNVADYIMEYIIG